MYSDGGGEFINKNLAKFLKGKGVKQTVSAPHTSEHNRVVERMLRSIISIARCLLIHSGLSQQFWCEAVWYACLVHSCTPTKMVDGMTSMEHKSGAKPDVSVFHTFRCKCFKMEYGKIKKFTFRVTQCIYLGLAVEGDEYCLYNKTTKCIISSHDVVFHKNIFKVRSDTVFMDNSTSTWLDNIEDNLTNWTSPSEWKFTATSVKKKQHNTGFAVSKGEGRSQISLTTQQQPQTPSLSDDTQFEIPVHNQIRVRVHHHSKMKMKMSEDDWENDPSSLVNSDNEDEDNIETETLQDNRGISSTTRISLMNIGLEGEDSLSTSLYTDRNASKSKQKLNITKQQSKALVVRETRTNYNL
jgi:hypothetical protein